MNALVLSGGGARGAYQAGVLQRIAEAFPQVPFPILCGSSAGSINVAHLATYARDFQGGTRRLGELWAGLSPERVYRTDALSLSSIAMSWLRDLGGGGLARKRASSLLDTTPLDALLRAEIDFTQIQPALGDRILHAVSVTATCYATEQTVSFVQAGAEVTPWQRPHRVAIKTRLQADHIRASSAIPFLFPAVKVGNQFYGDGSVRLGNPFSAPARLGASRILAISVRHPRETAPPLESVPSSLPHPPPAQVAGVLLNSVLLDAFDEDAAQLHRINSLLRQRSPTTPISSDTASLRPIELLVLSPSQDIGRLAAEHRHRFPPLVKWLLGGLGAGENESSSLASYLLFDSDFTRSLVQLGYEDAGRRLPEIEAFLRSAK